MKNEIYFKAAQLIAENKARYACRALWDVYYAVHPLDLERYNYIMDNYAFYFKPEKRDTKEEWFGSIIKEENQLARSLSLLFMYEMKI